MMQPMFESLIDAVRYFSNKADAVAWCIARRWPNGICCPYCDGGNVVPRRYRSAMTVAAKSNMPA